MLYKILTVILIGTLLLCCKSPSGEIRDTFEKVNASLDSSNKVLLRHNSYDLIYRELQLHSNNRPEILFHADSLFVATQSALEYINELSSLLKKADSSQESLYAADSMLLKGPYSDTLKMYLVQVYDRAKVCPVSNSARPALDNVLADISNIRKGEEWKKMYFHKTPTVAVITILAKFENDILNAGSIVFGDLLKQVQE